MDAQFEEFWSSPDYQEFVSSLNVDKVDALRDLLLLAALSDDIFTLQEREDVAAALDDLPGLSSDVSFDRAPVIDYVDDLYARYEQKGDLLLETLFTRLGDDVNLRHAFEAVVVLMATDDLAEEEARFARRLGVLMDLEDEFVDGLLSEYGWDLS